MQRKETRLYFTSSKPLFDPEERKLLIEKCKKKNPLLEKMKRDILRKYGL
ncbi:hypothetical protein BOVMAS02_14680 [Streptococcus uberis]|nr:hypothetical protein [Streptococcus uberis]MCK1192973.1 hypothetical protein [Streptococcus uberis]MCK1244588.1 hypothetical protein [Streptococcus uberis]MCK1246871.1 hypothetical protein [Streptococcus uberis]